MKRYLLMTGDLKRRQPIFDYIDKVPKIRSWRSASGLFRSHSPKILRDRYCAFCRAPQLTARCSLSRQGAARACFLGQAISRSSA